MRVTVIGGGVAGSAAAIALRRIGVEVTVHEAYEDPAGPVGSFVSLAVNGLRGLAALGVLEPVERAGFRVDRQLMWSGRGKLLGNVARGRRPGDTLRSVTLMRADLVRILRDEARRSGAEIVTGERLDPRAADGDLVVGADGIWSATRTTLDPTAPAPAYAGLYSISGISTEGGTAPARSRGAPATESPTAAVFNMTFGRRGAFIHLPAPDGTIWWSAQIAAASPPDVQAITLADVRERFAADMPVAPILAAATGIRTATLLHVLAPVQRRQDGRTVLVGDAAHPVGAGQGASMAVEDAVVLAGQLALTTDAPAALAAFDRLRYDRTRQLVKTESANRDAKTAGPVAARVRDVMMPLFVNRFYERATGWLYDFDPGQLKNSSSTGTSASAVGP